MAVIELKRRYHCSDDCVQSGCPGHTAEFEYQSVTDSYYFKGNKEHYFERNELETLIELLVELEEIRADGVQISELIEKLTKEK